MQMLKPVVFVPYWVVSQITRAGGDLSCLYDLEEAYTFLSAEDLASIHCLNSPQNVFANLIPECVSFTDNHWRFNPKFSNYIDPLVPLASGTLVDRLFSTDSYSGYEEGQEYSLFSAPSSPLVVSVQAGWLQAENARLPALKERLCLDILNKLSQTETFETISARPTFGVRINQLYEQVSAS
jgi:hypothetical protein